MFTVLCSFVRDDDLSGDEIVRFTSLVTRREAMPLVSGTSTLQPKNFENGGSAGWPAANSKKVSESVVWGNADSVKVVSPRIHAIRSDISDDDITHQNK